jgi:hypothetical protein
MDEEEFDDVWDVHEYDDDAEDEQEESDCSCGNYCMHCLDMSWSDFF